MTYSAKYHVSPLHFMLYRGKSISLLTVYNGLAPNYDHTPILGSITVPKEIDFPRYNMKCSGVNMILNGIFDVVSCFPLHIMLYRGNLDYFLDSVKYIKQSLIWNNVTYSYNFQEWLVCALFTCNKRTRQSSFYWLIS